MTTPVRDTSKECDRALSQSIDVPVLPSSCTSEGFLTTRVWGLHEDAGPAVQQGLVELLSNSSMLTAADCCPGVLS